MAGWGQIYCVHCHSICEVTVLAINICRFTKALCLVAKPNHCCLKPQYGQTEHLNYTRLLSEPMSVNDISDCVPPFSMPNLPRPEQLVGPGYLKVDMQVLDMQERRA